MACRLNRAIDFRSRRTVGAHRVQSYDACHVVEKLAGFLDVHNFTAFVIAAFWTGTMRHLALVTIWTFGEGMAFEGIMSAPASSARLRVSPFWIWHTIPF